MSHEDARWEEVAQVRRPWKSLAPLVLTSNEGHIVRLEQRGAFDSYRRFVGFMHASCCVYGLHFDLRYMAVLSSKASSLVKGPE